MRRVFILYFFNNIYNILRCDIMKNKDHKLRTLKKESYREEIINGPITSTLMKLAWPIMITNGMQVLYNIADTFWVGKISAQAVAAISISFPVVFLFISIGAGINISGTTLVAQYTGAGESENADKVATQLFVFIFSLS